ncbi:MAG: hypothetical protein KatS3mg061_0549 [Dehalococcoidia bacterium]|nr:MAG: hypothetical protein KatS3mg061_0549 [Dehalococcoidia bacterium]
MKDHPPGVTVVVAAVVKVMGAVAVPTAYSRP